MSLNFWQLSCEWNFLSASLAGSFLLFLIFLCDSRALFVSVSFFTLEFVDPIKPLRVLKRAAWIAAEKFCCSLNFQSPESAKSVSHFLPQIKTGIATNCGSSFKKKKKKRTKKSVGKRGSWSWTMSHSRLWKQTPELETLHWTEMSAW